MRAVATVLLVASLLAAADDGPDINLWPLVENAPNLEGGRTASALLLWHRSTDAAGDVTSQHILNWVSSPRFTAVLPLWFSAGEPGRRHQALLPLWFQGPGYTVAPPLLSGSWRQPDGGSSLWITPLFHRRSDAQGRTASLHALTWLEGDGYRILFPLAYRVGQPGQERTGVIPAWFSGPGWWAAPPLLSASWRRDDGGSTTWVTPLAHVGRDAQGRLDGMHVLTWLHGRDGDAILPLAWNYGPPEARRRGLLPLWMQGPGWAASPAALSGWWRNPDGGDSLWISPLFHRTTGPDGATRSLHLLNWLHDGDSDAVLPLAWMSGQPGHRHGAVLPLWLQGEGWWLAPPLLSGGVERADGTRTTVATPLYHRSEGPAGSSMHLGTWFSGEDAHGGYRMLLPLWWQVRRDGASWSGLLPLYLSGPTATVVPAALSGRWDQAGGGESLWVTPLFHRTTGADGATASLHAGLWWQNTSDDGLDRDGWPGRTAWRGLFPLWWNRQEVAHGTSSSSSALLPLWLQGDGWWFAPPLLSSWRREADGGSTTWITPLFHRTADAAGATRAMHAGLWYQDGDRRMLLPVWYDAGDRKGLIPLWFSTPEGWVAPPALSMHRRLPDGGTTTWLTPLYHDNRDADGALRSRHILNWFEGPDWQVLAPLAWRAGPPGRRHQGILPLFASGPDGWCAPAALSAGWRTADGGDSTWITPLAHLDRDAQGRWRGGHLLNWVQGEDWHALLPLAWQIDGADGRRRGLLPLYLDGPGWWMSPAALSGSWARPDGGRSTWITPLAHVGTDAAGALSDWHALNLVASRDGGAILPLAWWGGPPDARRRVVLPLLFQGPDHLVVAPLYFRWRGDDGGERSALLPLYARGPDWWASPALLSGGWRQHDGTRTTLVTPLYHRSVAGDGAVSQHLLNWIDTPGLQTVAPLWWHWREAGGERHDLLAPLWHWRGGAGGGSALDAYPLLFAWRGGGRLDTSLSTQLWPFLVQEADDGSEVNLLWRLWHHRVHAGARETMVGPLWWSLARSDAPTSWQILGGLVGHDVDPRSRTTLDYALWGAVRFGGRSAYAQPAQQP